MWGKNPNSHTKFQLFKTFQTNTKEKTQQSHKYSDLDAKI